MNVIIKTVPYITTAFLITLILTPLVRKLGLAINAYAVENNRTVHHGKMVRIGGIAIYLSFIITMTIFCRPDSTFNAIIIGGFIVFFGGLIDDVYNLKPLYKLIFQIVGAVYVIVFGNVELSILNFNIDPKAQGLIYFLISLLWIVGVTNAINLIDGLDGLACGVSFIILCVIGLIAYFMKRIDVSIVSLILCGAIGGMLPYNFNPAKLFIGDCAALFMGFMIACLSLLGFKSSTFISLGFPIIILFVPLADTSLAIIRRKLKGQKISEADRSHLHHVLMFKIGLSHRNTVLLLYLVTFMFATDAIIMYFNEMLGFIVLIILCIIAWLFIEATGMINPKFHPVLSLGSKVTGKNLLPEKLSAEQSTENIKKQIVKE